MTRKPNKRQPKAQYDYFEDEVSLGDSVIELSNGVEHIVNLVLDDGGVMVHKANDPEDYIFIPYGKYIVKSATKASKVHHYKNMVELALDLNDEEMFKEYSGIVAKLEESYKVSYAEPYRDFDTLGEEVTEALKPQTRTQTTMFLIDVALDNRDEEAFNKLTADLVYIKERKAELEGQLKEAKHKKQGMLVQSLEKRLGEL